MPHWHAHVEEDQWRVADYWLELEEGVLRYRAEGRDNPKDLWGWDYTYPPRPLDEQTLSEIGRLFGPEVAELVRGKLSL